LGLIRFLLALAVATEHASGKSYFPGFMAVQSFYIISGFYMSLILNEKYLHKKNAYKLFISNRFLRLFPSYWVVVLLTIFFSLTVYEVTHHVNGMRLSAYFQHYKELNFTSFAFLVFTNICVFFQDTVCFLGLDKHTGSLYFTSNFYSSDPPLYSFLLIQPAWTVGLELMYYLIAPFLVKRSLYIILGIMFLSLALRLILISVGLSHDPWNYRFFPTELLFFLLGTISYRIYIAIKDKLPGLNYAPVIIKASFIGVVLFTICYRLVQRVPGQEYLPILYYLIFFCTLPFIFSYTKKSKFDRFIGDLSYPIYISHMLIMDICATLHIPLGIGFTILISVLSVVFAILINKLLNDKIERYRQSRVVAEVAAVSSVNPL
jgi:peptidoglycan/LPS O-acetylase OafA/YrhL